MHYCNHAAAGGGGYECFDPPDCSGEIKPSLFRPACSNNLTSCATLEFFAAAGCKTNKVELGDILLGYTIVGGGRCDTPDASSRTSSFECWDAELDAWCHGHVLVPYGNYSHPTCPTTTTTSTPIASCHHLGAYGYSSNYCDCSTEVGHGTFACRTPQPRSGELTIDHATEQVCTGTIHPDAMTDQEQSVLPQQLSSTQEERPMECPPLIATARQFMYYMDQQHCDPSSFSYWEGGVYGCNLPNSTISLTAVTSTERDTFEADCWGWIDNDKELPTCTVPVIDSCAEHDFLRACFLYTNGTYFNSQSSRITKSCSHHRKLERFECLDRQILETQGQHVWCQGQVGSIGTFQDPLQRSFGLRTGWVQLLGG